MKDGEVIIVDEFTGRLMPGRRWSDGLHQAVEAKEGVKIERENQTLATITFQNYFRMYKKLAGMTGTAETEASEFGKIYNLDVLVIPTNKTLLRLENPDVVYRTEKEKYFAAADEIQKLHATGQPVLVGTTSIEKSERLSELLKKKGIKHVVLNAKYHEREAEIVAQAGRKGMVTIATNMAGRGTDILLGGNPEFMAKQECVKKGIAQPLPRRAGQNSGRRGRDQELPSGTTRAMNTRSRPTSGPKSSIATSWKPTKSTTKSSPPADCTSSAPNATNRGALITSSVDAPDARAIPDRPAFIFRSKMTSCASSRKSGCRICLQRLGMEEGVPIESRLISRRIENAQETVEGQNFEARKHLLEYDDVMNKQREAVYGLRRQLLEGLDQKDLILEDYVSGILSDLMDEFCPLKAHPDDWNMKGLKDAIFTRFGVDILAEGLQPETLNRQELGDAIFDKLKARYDAKEKLIGPDAMRYHERMIMLSVLDAQWKDHLRDMDHLKEGIGLRGYGQHDPLVEYKRESFDMFEAMMLRFQEDTVRYLYLMQVIERPTEGQAAAAHPEGTPQLGGNGNRPPRNVATSVDDIEEAFQRRKKRELEQARMAGSGEMQTVQQVVRGEKIGRNDPCHCGSGKKYKKCHGANA